VYPPGADGKISVHWEIGVTGGGCGTIGGGTGAG